MDNIARSLAVALGERDSNTLLHSDRVVRLAIEIGSHLNLSERELEVLAMGAQFHDIGKIGIPDNVLSKPAAFEASEWAIMKQHPLIGERIVRAIGDKYSPEIAQVVRHHHENFNGSATRMAWRVRIYRYVRALLRSPTITTRWPFPAPITKPEPIRK